MRALISGSQGFLGRHFQAELERRGWKVHGYDIKESEFFDCRFLFSRWGRDDPAIDLVIHCAAVVGGRATIDGNPLATAESIELDAAMFRWAAKAKPGRVVYLSSSAIYPVYRQEDAGTPLRESEVGSSREEWPEGAPDQVYGLTKLVGEVLAGKLREAGVPVTIVRPFSGYGADQDPTYPFPAFIARAKAREDPFTVWGDGHQTRDFIHVDDVVAGTLAAVDQDADGPLNLCTGRPVSFATLAGMVTGLAGYTPTFKFERDQPTGVRYRVGDPTRMLKVYRPQVTLEEGIRRALEEDR